jgi:hypothetical protein
MRKPIKPFTIEWASLPARSRNSKAAPAPPIVADKATPGRPMSENATRGSGGLSRRNSCGGKGAPLSSGAVPVFLTASSHQSIDSAPLCAT